MIDQILRDLGTLLTEVKDLLHRIAPDEFDALPFLLSLALHWGIARVTLEALVDILQGTARSIHATTCGILNLLAPQLPIDFTEPLALFLVKFEATMHRTRLLRSRKAHILSSPRRRNLTIRPNLSPQPITRRSNFLRFVTMAPLVIITTALVAVGTVARNLVRPTPSNLMSWLATFWYLNLLHNPFQLASSIHLGDIQLSAILTIGALFAVIYSIINSDVRGRAELNKTASLACRTTLHGCTYPLLTVASALHEIRGHSSRRLQKFPRRHEIKRIAYRSDLSDVS